METDRLISHKHQFSAVKTTQSAFQIRILAVYLVYLARLEENYVGFFVCELGDMEAIPTLSVSENSSVLHSSGCWRCLHWLMRYL